MRAGKLRHKVTIQQRANTTDAFGGMVTTWSDVATVWASVEPMTARELASASATYPEVTTKITMRYMSGVTAANRIIFEGKHYNLVPGIDKDMRHTELMFLAFEGTNEG